MRRVGAWSLVVALLLGAVACGDTEESHQAGQAEEDFIEDGFTVGEYTLSDADCPNFPSIDDGAQTTCTATASAPGRAARPAEVLVTILSCDDGSGDDSFSGCDFNGTATLVGTDASAGEDVDAQVADVISSINGFRNQGFELRDGECKPPKALRNGIELKCTATYEVAREPLGREEVIATLTDCAQRGTRTTCGVQVKPTAGVTTKGGGLELVPGAFG